MTRDRLRSCCRSCVALVVSGFSRTSSRNPPPKQAVIETSAGTFIIDLAPEAAPNQVAYFIRTAQQGGYDGTMFHRAIKYGMVQGGDPLSKDPAKRSQYGTGGLNAVKAEAHAPKMTRGSVAAVTGSGQARQRGRAVLHRARRSTGARRAIHGLRPRLGRHGSPAEDLGDAGRCQRAGDRACRDPPRHDS